MSIGNELLSAAQFMEDANKKGPVSGWVGKEVFNGRVGKEVFNGRNLPRVMTTLMD